MIDSIIKYFTFQASNSMGTVIQDFSPTSGSLIFQNGESLKQLSISIFSDKVFILHNSTFSVKRMRSHTTEIAHTIRWGWRLNES